MFMKENNNLDLSKLREKIDEIDRQILLLFLKRMDVCSSVAEYKKQIGKPILDLKREKEVLESKVLLLDENNKQSADEVYELFSSIMAISRKRQSRLIDKNNKKIDDLFRPVPPKENPTVVFYGTNGSYSEEAAIKYFGKTQNRFNAKNFEDAFEALKCREADYAVLPIENSNTGTIVDVMDLIEKYGFFIVGETDIPIRHCLMGTMDADIDDIRHIYSHEQGIRQSRDFLKTLTDVVCEEYYSTAQSAKKVSIDNDKTQAAIAGRRNAEIYGLKILAEDINNSDKNTTRFIVVSKNPEVTDECNKISAAFTLAHESGELYRVLSTFAHGNLNLLKIESRPLEDRNFEYMFFVDYTGNLLDENVRRVTNEVIESTGEFKILGNYKIKK